MERKSFKLSVKAVDEGTGTFTGYASVFDNVDRMREIVMPGAFKRTLDHSGGQVPILWQHRLDEPIGVSMQMREDAKGLYVEGQLNLETQRGREAYALLRQGALKGMSIGYDVLQDGWTKGARQLKELRLHEFSLVTLGANPLALVSTVKTAAPEEQKAQAFGDALANEVMEDYQSDYLDNLHDALDEVTESVAQDESLSSDGQMLALSQALDDFKSSYMAWAESYIASGAPDLPDDADGDLDIDSDGQVSPAKAAQPGAVKAGRVLSRKNRGLITQVAQMLNDLLAATDSSLDSTQKGHSETEDKADEPVAQKSADPDATPSAELQRLIDELSTAAAQFSR